MPCSSAIRRSCTGSPESNSFASSSIARQAYSVLAESFMVVVSRDAERSASSLDTATISFLNRVQPALSLECAAPTAGTLIRLAGAHRDRTRPATDAWISLVVQRIVGNALVGDPFPHVLLGPICER